MFNLNFNLTDPREMSMEFLKQLNHTYKNDLKDSNEKDLKIKRKVIVLVVSASALEKNHRAIIYSDFYSQFKKNINDNYQQLRDANEEVELFGLVNLALNKSLVHTIHQDLKKIHKIALKNEKIDFKTKVDLFSECSKALGKIAATSQEKLSTNREVPELMENCLKALLFSLIKLITLLKKEKFVMFKYFL